MGLAVFGAHYVVDIFVGIRVAEASEKRIKKRWITGVTTVEGLPASLHDYIAMVEDEMKIPVKVVSVGPDRAQTIQR